MNYNKAEFTTSFGSFSQIPPSDRLEIAFSGRSNVGKSSLINKIFNRKSLARVSSMPGKTVTINFFSLENIYIVDLPGYGFANVSKSEKSRWGELIGGYLGDGDRDLALVFQLIDMRHAPSKDDLQMLDFLIDNEIPFVIIFTKADKLRPMQRKDRMNAFATEIPCFEDITYVEFSAVTGEGVEEIREIIDDVSQDAEITSPEERLAEKNALRATQELEEYNALQDRELADETDLPQAVTGFLTPNKKKN